jgi:hypothetical protein
VANSEKVMIFKLKDSVEFDDLQVIKEILERFPGNKPVLLNLLVEGQRQDVPTGILVEDIGSLKVEMKPYVE